MSEEPRADHHISAHVEDVLVYGSQQEDTILAALRAEPENFVANFSSRLWREHLFTLVRWKNYY